MSVDFKPAVVSMGTVVPFEIVISAQEPATVPQTSIFADCTQSIWNTLRKVAECICPDRNSTGVIARLDEQNVILAQVDPTIKELQASLENCRAEQVKLNDRIVALMGKQTEISRENTDLTTALSASNALVGRTQEMLVKARKVCQEKEGIIQRLKDLVVEQDTTIASLQKKSKSQ